ncbi:MAG: homoserine kinase [Epsilonproteobacteria bacterium]|jgi:homoserine kinase|nr:homoserine kinase [Campylobacterota bacterium]NPA89764.1 homoserine kinase [Campylobacterota bacterium]
MVITIPATSANLGPGFDTMGLSINLRNEVEIVPSPYREIIIDGEGAEILRRAKRNYFVDIFEQTYRELTGKEPKFKIRFFNRIPISRGLGSSSSAIVGALTGAYEMAGVPIRKEKLISLALKYEPHPDNITPATVGGFCVAKVKRERVYFLKKFIPPLLKAVIVIPNRPISTSKSRGALKREYPLKDVVTNISSTAMITAAFFSERFEMLKYVVEDKVHQEERMKAVPDLFKVREIALNNGALMATLSGSGSSYFCLAYRDDAYQIRDALATEFRDFMVRVYHFDNYGVKVYR